MFFHIFLRLLRYMYMHIYIHDLYDLYLCIYTCTVLYCTVLYCTVLYCTVLYCTVPYGLEWNVSLPEGATHLFHRISAVQVGFQGTNGGRCWVQARLRSGYSNPLGSWRKTLYSNLRLYLGFKKLVCSQPHHRIVNPRNGLLKIGINGTISSGWIYLDIPSGND